MSLIAARRAARILASYRDCFQPLMQHAGNLIPNSVMLDVGSGEGIIALESAKDAHCSRLILTDVSNFLVVPLPENAEFIQADVCDDRFLSVFQNRVSLVTCINAFHEFRDPLKAAHNMCNVLPRGGTLLLLDYAEEGWSRQAELSRREGSAAVSHYREDVQNIARTGLGTDAGIAKFWASLFSTLPGQGVQTLNGDLYTVVYIARNWGELKQRPQA